MAVSSLHFVLHMWPKTFPLDPLHTDPAVFQSFLSLMCSLQFPLWASPSSHSLTGFPLLRVFLPYIWVFSMPVISPPIPLKQSKLSAPLSSTNSFATSSRKPSPFPSPLWHRCHGCLRACLSVALQPLCSLLSLHLPSVAQSSVGTYHVENCRESNWE